MVVKGKAPVDPECTAKLGTAHVFTEGKDLKIPSFLYFYLSKSTIIIIFIMILAVKTVVVKGKAPVDPECTAKLGTAHVFTEGKDIYDVMLNQV